MGRQARRRITWWASGTSRIPSLCGGHSNPGRWVKRAMGVSLREWRTPFKGGKQRKPNLREPSSIWRETLDVQFEGQTPGRTPQSCSWLPFLGQVPKFCFHFPRSVDFSLVLGLDPFCKQTVWVFVGQSNRSDVSERAKQLDTCQFDSETSAG